MGNPANFDWAEVDQLIAVQNTTIAQKPLKIRKPISYKVLNHPEQIERQF